METMEMTKEQETKTQVTKTEINVSEIAVKNKEPQIIIKEGSIVKIVNRRLACAGEAFRGKNILVTKFYDGYTLFEGKIYPSEIGLPKIDMQFNIGEIEEVINY